LPLRSRHQRTRAQQAEPGRRFSPERDWVQRRRL